jgi:hypothetical protein
MKGDDNAAVSVPAEGARLDLRIRFRPLPLPVVPYLVTPFQRTF